MRGMSACAHRRSWSTTAAATGQDAAKSGQPRKKWEVKHTSVLRTGRMTVSSGLPAAAPLASASMPIMRRDISTVCSVILSAFGAPLQQSGRLQRVVSGSDGKVGGPGACGRAGWVGGRTDGMGG